VPQRAPGTSKIVVHDAVVTAADAVVGATTKPTLLASAASSGAFFMSRAYLRIVMRVDLVVVP